MIESYNIQYSNYSDLLEAPTHFYQHSPEHMLIQVFSGQTEKLHIETLLKDLKDVFPGVAVIGVTTAGEIVDGRVQEHSIIINITTFETTTVRSTLVHYHDELWVAGKEIANTLRSTEPKGIILFGTSLVNGRTLDATALLNSIQNSLPGVIIGGAQAGDNGDGIISYVFSDGGISHYGAVAVSLSGEELSVHNTYNLSWVPIGKKLTITRASGPRVYSIDNRTPLDLYNHYLGPDVVEDFPLSSADFPLIIERDGIPMAIHALGVNDDGSFDYIHSFHVGEQVQFGFCHSDLLSQAAKRNFDELNTHSNQVAFIYSCVSRKWILGQDINVELSPIASLAPTAGFFAYGEYYTLPSSGKSLFFSQTMTVLTLAETVGGEVKSSLTKQSEQELSTTDSQQLKTLRVLHRLVETSAREIEFINNKLADLANEDPLTGLLNRRFFDRHFEDEYHRAQRYSTALSLILLDIDFFKQYNDTHGHVQGDSCIRGVASVLKQIPRRASDCVARYGGEEFICTLPNTPYKDAMDIAEMIRARIVQLAIPHGSSQVAQQITVSVGVHTWEPAMDDSSATELITLCDEQLYRAKAMGRNCVVGSKGVVEVRAIEPSRSGGPRHVRMGENK